MELTNDEMIKICSMLKAENKLNESMSKFGSVGFITISEVTREIRKNPEIMKIFNELLKKLDEFEKHGNAK